MQQGFIKIHRKIIENPIYRKSELIHLFLHCILNANFKDNKVLYNGKTIEVKRGSFITGRGKLSSELGMNGNTIYKYLKELEELDYIKVISNNKYSVIEVINYGQYQDKFSSEVIKTENSVSVKKPVNTALSEGNGKCKNNVNMVEKPISRAFTEIFQNEKIKRNNKNGVKKPISQAFTNVNTVNRNKSVTTKTVTTKKACNCHIDNIFTEVENDECNNKNEKKNTSESLSNKVFSEINEVEKYRNNKKTVEKPISQAFTDGGSVKCNKSVTQHKNDKEINNYYRNFVVKLFITLTNKEKSYCYAIVNKLLKLKKCDTEITLLQKCLMLMYVIKNNRDKINNDNIIGVLINQYRELSYIDFHRKVFEGNKAVQFIYEPNNAGALN